MSELPDPESLRGLSALRWRWAVRLTIVMLAIYFGFILLAAYAKEAMGAPLSGGLSLGILLGALVIASAFVLTGIYVRWANNHYDPALGRLRTRLRESDAKAGKDAEVQS